MDGNNVLQEAALRRSLICRSGNRAKWLAGVPDRHRRAQTLQALRDDLPLENLTNQKPGAWKRLEASIYTRWSVLIGPPRLHCTPAPLQKFPRVRIPVRRCAYETPKIFTPNVSRTPDDAIAASVPQFSDIIVLTEIRPHVSAPYCRRT